MSHRVALCDGFNGAVGKVAERKERAKFGRILAGVADAPQTGSFGILQSRKESRIKAVCRREAATAVSHRTATPFGRFKVCYRLRFVLRRVYQCAEIRRF